MTDSKTASDSLENGFDPPDVPSSKVTTENKDVAGDVSGSSNKDAEEKKSVGVVVEDKDLEDLKVGADEDDVKELKDVENEKFVEITHNIDGKDCGSTKDGEEKNDVQDVKDIDDNEKEEKKEDARVITEGNEKKGFGETMYMEGHNDANNIEDGTEKKGTEVANEMKGKSDVGEMICMEGQKDAKEAKELDENTNVVKALDEEKEEGFGKTKDEKVKMIVEETKHEEDKVVEEKTNGKLNDVAEAMKDVDGENNVQAFDNETDKGEKNYISDVKSSEKEESVEGKVHKDDNIVEQLQYGENKQVEQETNVDVKNNLKPAIGDEPVKVKRKPRDIEKVEAETGKKKVVVNDESEETIAIRSLEDEKEDIVEGMLISEDEDAAAEEEEEDDDIEKKSSNKKVTKKRSRGQRSANKSDVKDKSKAKGKKESGKKSKELTSTTIDAVSSPIGSSRERPVRERKTVERLVEVIEKEPNKAVIIEKGQGTPLKDIPNVAYKLAKKKPADLKFLHQTLFGRRGKVVDFKSNILQFSGFAWHEAEEKQRAKIKEKLDKCIKDNLLDLCDLLDLTASKTNTKKEELIVKLVDFLEAPHATTDVILAEKDQSDKSRKRKRFSEGSGSRSSGGTPARRSRKKSAKAEGTPTSSGKIQRDIEDEDEEENTENGVPGEDDAPRLSESDAKENELLEASDDEGENEDDDEGEKENKDTEQSPRKQSSAIVEKRRTGSNSKKVSSEMQVKSPVKTPSSYKQLKVKNNDTGEKVFTRKKKKGSESPEATQASDDEGENEDIGEVGKRNQDIKQSPKRQGSSISKKRKRMGSNSKKASSQTVVKSPVKTPSSHKQTKVEKVEKDDTGEKVFTRKKKDSGSTMKSNSKTSVKDNSGKKAGKGKITGEERKSAPPNKTALRKSICDILKEVDFNTATFTDILKKLAAHYNMDLTPKKAAIKQMIQEELTKMAEEAEDSEEEEKEETEKEENRKPSVKKVKT